MNRYSHKPTISLLPSQWLAEIADRIDEDGGGDEFCASRRSAGIPCIVQVR